MNDQPVAPGADEELWPKDQKADPSKLFQAIEELAIESADSRTRHQVETVKKEFAEAKELIENPPELFLSDLPDACLQGRLGEICERRLRHCPRSYGWIALLTAASARMDERAPGVCSNLYGCVVGGVHTGKSQSIEFAIRSLGIERPTLMDTVSGSAEALVRETAGAAGNPRLFCPDELGHTLQKLQIERSSFSFVLNTAYYKSQFRVLMGKKETADFNCELSILGGLVEERFSDLFNSATTGGLYDRFIFGVCPGDFQFVYEPFTGLEEQTSTVKVHIDPEVWQWRAEFEKSHKEINPRVVESAIRAATICASFDGVRLIQPKHLVPHIEFAFYQSRIRSVLKPNPGENFEGQLAHKFLDYLGRRRGLVTRRELLRATHAYDKGPSVADRALDILIANGDVTQMKSGRQTFLRLASEEGALGEAE